MIDVLYNKLGSAAAASAASAAASVEWKDIDPAIFNRHSQASQASQASPALQNVASKIIQKSQDVEKAAKAVKAAKVAVTTIQTVPRVLDTLTSVTSVTSVTGVTGVTQQTTFVPPATTATAAIIFKNKKKPAKDTSIKPLEIIMNETASFHNSSEYIKESLINFITKEEFSKIFGLTKCAEIMSGIVNNRWNKSTALFISFLLDKEVYYNDKAILYNKEKNRGIIMTTATTAAAALC